MVTTNTDPVKRQKEKPKQNIVFIGHVDSGKSTVTGHLVFKLQKMTDDERKKMEIR